MVELVMLLVLAVSALLLILVKLIRDDAVQVYKVAYYERKLKNRGVNISSVENITRQKILLVLRGNL